MNWAHKEVELGQIELIENMSQSDHQQLSSPWIGFKLTMPTYMMLFELSSLITPNLPPPRANSKNTKK